MGTLISRVRWRSAQLLREREREREGKVVGGGGIPRPERRGSARPTDRRWRLSCRRPSSTKQNVVRDGCQKVVEVVGSVPPPAGAPRPELLSAEGNRGRFQGLLRIARGTAGRARQRHQEAIPKTRAVSSLSLSLSLRPRAPSSRVFLTPATSLDAMRCAGNTTRTRTRAMRRQRPDSRTYPEPTTCSRTLRGGNSMTWGARRW